MELKRERESLGHSEAGKRTCLLRSILVAQDFDFESFLGLQVHTYYLHSSRNYCLALYLVVVA